MDANQPERSAPPHRPRMAIEKRRSKRNDTLAPSPKLAGDFLGLSRRILRYANRGVPRIDFLREVSKMLMGFSKCDAVELRLRDSGLHYRWEATRRPKPSFRFVILPGAQKEDGEIIPRSPASGLQNNAGLERLCRDVVRGRFDPSLPFFTRNGSFWTGDTERPLRPVAHCAPLLRGLKRGQEVLQHPDFGAHGRAGSEGNASPVEMNAQAFALHAGHRETKILRRPVTCRNPPKL